MAPMTSGELSAGITQGLRPLQKEVHDNGRDGRDVALTVGRWVASAIVYAAVFGSVTRKGAMPGVTPEKASDVAQAVTAKFWKATHASAG